MTIKDFFLGKFKPLKFNTGDMVKYKPEFYHPACYNGLLSGKVVSVDQARGLDNHYTIISEDVLDHKGEPMRVSVCETRIELDLYYRTFVLKHAN